MKTNASKLVVIAVCCLMAVAFVPSAIVSDAYAGTSGTDGGASVGDDSHAEEGGLFDWLFGFLFGGSDDDGSSSDASSASAEGAKPSQPSESASGSSEVSDDPFSRPVESEADAVNRVHDCLMRAGKQVPLRIVCEKMTDDGRYLIRGYEVVRETEQQGADFDPEDGDVLEHEATWFWYSVGRDGSIYDETMMREIDPETMEPVAQGEAQPKATDNDYYTLSLPSKLSNCKVTYEEGKFGGPFTVGAITGVVKDGTLLFEVVVLSDDWGPQGDMAILEIGTPSTDPSSVVYLTVPVGPVYGTERDSDTAEAKAREYAAYVSLK